MINHLHDISFRIFTIKTPGTVTMGLWPCFHPDLVSIKEFIPIVYKFRGLEYESDMIQPLRTCRPLVRGDTMQGQIVRPGTKVDTVGVRSPFHLHAEEANIKIFTGLQVYDV